MLGEKSPKGSSLSEIRAIPMDFQHILQALFQAWVCALKAKVVIWVVRRQVGWRISQPQRPASGTLRVVKFRAESEHHFSRFVDSADVPSITNAANELLAIVWHRLLLHQSTADDRLPDMFASSISISSRQKTLTSTPARQ